MLSGTPGIKCISFFREGTSNGGFEEVSLDSRGACRPISGKWLQALLLGVLMNNTLYPPMVDGMFATQLSS